MTAESRFERVKSLVLEARARQGQARRAFLDEACGGDAELRDEVESLLAFEDEAPSLLESGEVLRRLDPLATERTGGPSDAAAALGESIGPYTLVGVVGEGGMGVVYRARQERPIRREVALKLVRRGLDTERVVARFASERQALARMDHPGIARVYDAGASADGRPFFVMELVDGQPITEYCDDRCLDVRQRVALAIRVAHAVQHAHQKGIVHRDLKPSNVLVGTHDGEPAPKVIDFGIAKALHEPLAGEVELTREGQVIGTPDYMSPEQAGVVAADVDTRTDVYALGVMLYELLAGRRPRRFTRGTQEEIARAFRDQEPTRPSTAVTDRRGRLRAATGTDGPAIDDIARTRRTTADRLRRHIAGDLDNIVLKAIEKDPDRRYASVEHFADDLRRFLRGEPVLARGQSWSYRTGKFVARHALGVGLSAAALLVLVAFTGTTLVQSARVARERDRARQEAETARRVSEFLTSIFAVADPTEARGETVTARELLDRGAATIATDLAGEPEVQARLLHTMGIAYKQLGLYDQALALQQRARQATESLAADPARLADVLDEIGDVARYKGDLERAGAAHAAALEWRRAGGEEGLRLASTLNHLALVAQELGEFEEAERLQLEALALRRRHATGEQQRLVGNSLMNLGIVLRQRGRLDEAELAAREAVDIFRAQTAGDDRPPHPSLASALTQLGALLLRKGALAEAEPVIREALDLRTRMLGPTHPRTIDSLNELANLVHDQGRFGEAEPLYRTVLESESRQLPDSLDEAVARNNLASLLEDMGRFDEAEPLFRRSLEIRQKVRGPRHVSVATALNNLGRLELGRGRLGAAETLLREALSIRREQLGEDHAQTAVTRYQLGRLLHARGQLHDARREHEAALDTMRRTLPEHHANVVSVKVARGRVLTDLGRAEEVIASLREAVAARAAALPEGDWRIAEAHLVLGRALLAAGSADEGVALVRRYAPVVAAATAAPVELRADATRGLALARQRLAPQPPYRRP
ncbi:MAG: serine/threonine-protein kinase [Acidobacteria bacterium]|nr:serine/threonine-protein kinase [Acidobacteriota bacterium]